MKPKDKLFKQLIEILRKHFCPSPYEIVQYYKFNSRVHQDGESVAIYMLEVRALAQYCNFGETLWPIWQTDVQGEPDTDFDTVDTTSDSTTLT